MGVLKFHDKFASAGLDAFDQDDAPFHGISVNGSRNGNDVVAHEDVVVGTYHRCCWRKCCVPALRHFFNSQRSLSAVVRKHCPVLATSGLVTTKEHRPLIAIGCSLSITYPSARY